MSNQGGLSIEMAEATSSLSSLTARFLHGRSFLFHPTKENDVKEIKLRILDLCI